MLAAWDAKIPDDDECIHVEREGGKDGKEGTVLKATLGPKLPTFTLRSEMGTENGKSGENKKSRVWITKTPIKPVQSKMKILKKIICKVSNLRPIIIKG